MKQYDDDIPEEDEVDWAVFRLRRNRAGGLCGMGAENLRSWIKEVEREELNEPMLLEKVVRLMQTAFREGHLAEDCTWKTVVMTPKGNGDSRGIGIVEVLWKKVTGIRNHRLMAAI